MLMLLTALLLGYACFLPITLQADVHHHASTQTRIIIHVAGLTKTWHFSGLTGAATQLRQSRTRLLLEMFRRADKARAFLLRRLHLEQLDALLLLCTGNAARSALLTGAIQGTLAFIPHLRRRNVRIRVLPDFFRERSTVSARCIIRLRVGTIILTAMMLLIAHFRGQRLTESEAV